VPTADCWLPIAFSSAYAVTNTRSLVSTGEEWPGGSGVFQTTFFSGPNTSGSPVDAVTPLPFGPRNCGQSSATAPLAANIATSDAINRAPIVFVNFNTFLREFVLRERKVLFSTRTVLMRACKASAILIQAWRKRNAAEATHAGIGLSCDCILSHNLCLVTAEGRAALTSMVEDQAQPCSTVDSNVSLLRLANKLSRCGVSIEWVLTSAI
jgi:hypothetical protein